MWVHAKTPLIDVEITGEGIQHVIALVKKMFKHVEVKKNKDSVPVRDTQWFKKLEKTLTSGKALKVYRDNAALTLAQLAKKTGIAEPHLSAMENDKRSIGKITAQKLGNALDCDYHRFL